MGVFESPKEYQYEDGALLLGTYPSLPNTYPRQNTMIHYAIGVKTERHAITFAGSGSGKGAAVLIPNAKLWPHNLLVIDPKGEVAKATVEDRAAKGQNVYVIDPWGQSGVDEKFLASFNPLDMLDPDSLDIKEDIDIISDGIVKRDNPDSSHWDDGAQAIISGLIAFVLVRAEKDRKNLIEVRAIIRDPDGFAQAIEEMKDMSECGGVCQAGASAAYAKEGGYFVSNAEKNTRWLDSQRMKNCLVETTFSMADLKRGKASIFLVLPAKQLKNHGRFLRLFIRCAISEMMNPMPDGSEKGEECLFLLDEFFALGFIEEIMVSIGLMRSMGLKLWPVMQDIGQLEKLYGREGMQTFFSNTDVHQFFGNTDPQTLDFISQRIGVFGIDDLPDAPLIDLTRVHELHAEINAMKPSPSRAGIGLAAKDELQWAREDYNERLSRFNTDASRIIGKPRLDAAQIAHLIRKEGEGVAASSICFVFGMRRLNLHLLPHWQMNGKAVSWEALPWSPPAHVIEKGRAMAAAMGDRKAPPKKIGFFEGLFKR